MLPLAPRAAQALALAIVVWMTALQYVLTPGTQAPPALFVVFLVAWAAAFLMLGARPVLGGAYSALLGVASVFGSLRTHAGGWENWVLIGLSAAAAVAGVLVVVASRARRAESPT